MTAAIKRVRTAAARKPTIAVAIVMMSLSGAVHADDPVKRLLDLQLKKGIITQEEYDEFMSAPTNTQDQTNPAGNGANAPTAGSESIPVIQTGKDTTPTAPANAGE